MEQGIMRWILLILICIPAFIYGQDERHKIFRPKADLSLKGIHFQSQHVEVSYDVPFEGVIEMYVMDSDSSVIYRGRRVIPSGENRLVLRTNELDPGGSYLLRLNYKEDEEWKWLNIPGS